MSKIEAVLFDLDGTLLDRDASLRAFVRGQHERLGVALGHVAREGYEARFIELDDRGHRWKDEVYQALVEELAITEAAWPALLADYEARFCEHCVAFPGAREALQVLAGRFKLGLVSNGRAEFQERSIEALGIGSCFGAVLISEREGVRKPGPEIFHRAAARLQVLPEACAFVGDHPEADVAGARGAGMRAVWKPSPFWPPPRAVDAIVENLDELPRVLEALEEAE